MHTPIWGMYLTQIGYKSRITLPNLGTNVVFAYSIWVKMGYFVFQLRSHRASLSWILDVNTLIVRHTLVLRHFRSIWRSWVRCSKFFHSFDRACDSSLYTRVRIQVWAPIRVPSWACIPCNRIRATSVGTWRQCDDVLELEARCNNSFPVWFSGKCLIGMEWIKLLRTKIILSRENILYGKPFSNSDLVRKSAKPMFCTSIHPLQSNFRQIRITANLKC